MSLNSEKSLIVVSRVKRSYLHYNKRLFIIQLGSDDAIIIFGVNRLGVFGRGM
jgi:hypothetical protein